MSNAPAKAFPFWMMTSVMPLLLCIPAAWAQQEQATGEEDNAPVTETRVFDIRPLLLEVPDYRVVFSDLRSDDIYGTAKALHEDATDDGDDGDESCFGGPRSRRDNAGTLMEMLRTIVCRDSWRWNGGLDGYMDFYAGQLVVHNTPEALAEVERLLDLLKVSRSARLRLDACFVAVDVKAPAAELAGLRDNTQFTPEEFRGLLETLNEHVSVTRASISGFEGQRIFTTAGQQHNVFIGTEAVVASGATAHIPVARQLVSGVTLETQSVLDQDKQTVLVDLRASLGHLDRPTRTEPGPIDPLAVGSSLPPYQVAHFATSVAVPMSRFSLVGTARYDGYRDLMLFVMPTQE